MDREALLRPSLYRTMLFVALSGVALAMIDGVLAKTEQSETTAEAARFYGDGLHLLQSGNPAAAAEAFRSAIANARDNTVYPLALGQALTAAGNFDQALDVLGGLLRADSTAGAPNLAMARLFAREDRTAEAASYYHRAIYGQWTEDPQGNRVKARFELADLLAAHNAKAELLSELLPLQDEIPPTSDAHQKLARLYLAAGSPTRAATILRELAHSRPQDASLHSELGDAEFARADYSAARTSYLTALRLRPGDPQASGGLQLSDQVLDLDPLRRGLTEAERYKRSIRILQLVNEKNPQCLPPNEDASHADLVRAVNAALKRPVGAAVQVQATESNLDLANKLWQTERVTCSSAVSRADLPLDLVLTKSTQ